jgi:hypothetical protein
LSQIYRPLTLTLSRKGRGDKKNLLNYVSIPQFEKGGRRIRRGIL